MPWSIKTEMVSRRVQMGVDKHDMPINIGVDTRGRIKPDGYLKHAPERAYVVRWGDKVVAAAPSRERAQEIVKEGKAKRRRIDDALRRGRERRRKVGM